MILETRLYSIHGLLADGQHFHVISLWEVFKATHKVVKQLGSEGNARIEAGGGEMGVKGGLI